MVHSRVGVLDERVREIRNTVDRLCEEHTVVRERLEAVASTVDGSPDGDAGQPSPEIGSAWPDAGFSEQSDSSLLLDGDRRTDASDAEVAAAIPSVADDGGEEVAENGTEEDRDDIIVA